MGKNNKNKNYIFNNSQEKQKQLIIKQMMKEISDRYENDILKDDKRKPYKKNKKLEIIENSFEKQKQISNNEKISNNNNIFFKKNKENKQGKIISNDDNEINITKIFKINEPKEINYRKTTNHDYKIKLTSNRYIYVYSSNKQNDAYVKLKRNKGQKIKIIPKWYKMLFWTTSMSLLIRISLILGILFTLFSFIFYMINFNTEKYHLNFVWVLSNFFNNKSIKNNIQNLRLRWILFLVFILVYFVLFIFPILFFKRKFTIKLISMMSMPINIIWFLYFIISLMLFDDINSNLYILILLEVLGIFFILLGNLVILINFRKTKIDRGYIWKK